MCIQKEWRRIKHQLFVFFLICQLKITDIYKKINSLKNKSFSFLKEMNNFKLI